MVNVARYVREIFVNSEKFWTIYKNFQTCGMKMDESCNINCGAPASVHVHCRHCGPCVYFCCDHGVRFQNTLCLSLSELWKVWVTSSSCIKIVHPRTIGATNQYRVSLRINVTVTLMRLNYWPARPSITFSFALYLTGYKLYWSVECLYKIFLMPYHCY